MSFVDIRGPAKRDHGAPDEVERTFYAAVGEVLALGLTLWHL